MPTQHWKGAVIPAVGDDLVASWPTFVDTSGISIPASDLASARVLAESAIAAGATISSATPASFLIGGSGQPKRRYTMDGTRTSGVLNLLKDDMVEGVEDSYAGGTITKGTGTNHALITSKLPAQPYPRICLALGMVNAGVTGTIGLKTLILNRDGQTSRWETGGGQQSQVSMNMGIIPAGTDPQIILALTFGGTGNSTATISSAADANRLTVFAWPISA